MQLFHKVFPMLDSILVSEAEIRNTGMAPWTVLGIVILVVAVGILIRILLKRKK